MYHTGVLTTVNMYITSPVLIYLFLKDFIYICLERGKGREKEREREREGEKHQCVVASNIPPTGDLARNPGMCPDWESDQ